MEWNRIKPFRVYASFVLSINLLQLRYGMHCLVERASQVPVVSLNKCYLMSQDRSNRMELAAPDDLSTWQIVKLPQLWSAVDIWSPHNTQGVNLQETWKYFRYEFGMGIYWSGNIDTVGCWTENVHARAPDSRGCCLISRVLYVCRKFKSKLSVSTNRRVG